MLLFLRLDRVTYDHAIMEAIEDVPTASVLPDTAAPSTSTDVGTSAAAPPNPSEDNVVRQSTRMKIPSLKRLATEVDVDNETHDSVEDGTQVKRRQARPALTYADLYVGLHVYAKWIVSFTICLLCCSMHAHVS